MRKIKQSKKRVAHVIAVCKECDFETENYNTGRREAQQHVAKTGHLVSVETGVFYDIYASR